MAFWLVHENLVSSNELIKVELLPRKTWKADVSRVSPLSFALVKSVVGCVASFSEMRTKGSWCGENEYISFNGDYDMLDNFQPIV